MNMKHRLARSASVVNDHPIPLRVQAFVGGDLFRGQEQVSDKIFVGFGHAVNIGDVFFRDNERVDGRLGIYVFEGGNRIVLVHDF